VFALGANPAWYYDEMLISGDRVVVVGYGQQGTELNLFHIAGDGRLSYRSTYHLRSNDYYSSRNYASRLMGSTLVFYTPMYLGEVRSEDQLTAALPALRQWRGADEGAYRPIVSLRQVYAPGVSLTGAEQLALHTVTLCDLSRKELDCRATVLVGPPGRVFYVSSSAVYVWSSDWVWRAGRAPNRSRIFRIPLDGSAPSALVASGSPVDQFSFSEQGGFLNVLVRSGAGGDGMWSSEWAGGRLSLLRVKLDAFGDERAVAPLASYLGLPDVRDGYGFVNRFVGDYLLYGSGSGWGEPSRAPVGMLQALRLGRSAASPVALTHSVDRIEVMGPDAVVMGSGADSLHFTAIDLSGRPRSAQRYAEAGASQGELRSHGFFYKPDPDGGNIGLPISRPARPGYAHLFDESSAVVFLRNQGARFHPLGELEARPSSARDDCRTSCNDWYGNSRPIFLQGRVFALLGYEIVEGRIDDGRIREVQRASFAPPSVLAGRRR
jgi:hypothetical protein